MYQVLGWYYLWTSQIIAYAQRFLITVLGLIPFNEHKDMVLNPAPSLHFWNKKLFIQVIRLYLNTKTKLIYCVVNSLCISDYDYVQFIVIKHKQLCYVKRLTLWAFYLYYVRVNITDKSPSWQACTDRRSNQQPPDCKGNTLSIRPPWTT